MSPSPPRPPRVTARTVFLIEVGGEPQALLAIQQRGDGDVALLVPGGDPAEGAERIAGYRLHARLRADPEGTLVFYDYATPDGARLRSKLLIRPRRNTLLYPLYSVRYPDPSGRARHAGHPLDQRVDVTAYDPSLSVLVFHVVLSSRGHALDGLSEFNTTGVDVGASRISLLWGFMRSPSLADGSVKGVGLAPADGRAVRVDEAIVETRKSVSTAELIAELRHARSALSVDHINALKQLFDKEKVTADPRFERVALHYALAPLA